MEKTELYRKVRGCLLGGAIGDALGGPVENWTPEEIHAKYGILDRFIPYDRPQSYHGHFGVGECVGVYTDDTRLKHLYCESIFRAGAKPRSGDLVQTIAEAYHSAPDDMHKGFLEDYYLKSVWQRDKVIFSGEPTNGAIMANSPLGLVTACRPTEAYQLGFDLAWFTDGYAKSASAIMVAAVAAAMRPGCTVDEVIVSARDAHIDFTKRREGEHWPSFLYRYGPNLMFLDKALEIARDTRDVFQIREPLYELLEWGHLFSEATHTLVVALSMFVAAEGDFEKSIIGSIMYGRDKDSYASVAGALAGAYCGDSEIRQDWLRTVVAANPSVDMDDYSRRLVEIIIKEHQSARRSFDDLEELL